MKKLTWWNVFIKNKGASGKYIGKVVAADEQEARNIALRKFDISLEDIFEVIDNTFIPSRG